MLKIILSFFILSFSYLAADTDAKIYDTQNKIDALAKEIRYQENIFSKIENELTQLNKTISQNKDRLEQTKKEINTLDQQAINIQLEILQIENKIVDEMVTTYSTSLGLALAKKATKAEIIDKEIYSILTLSSKDNVVKLTNKTEKLKQNQIQNEKKQKEYKSYILNQEKKKKVYSQKKELKQTVISTISQHHDKYKKELDNVLEKQDTQTNLLIELHLLEQQNSMAIETNQYTAAKTIAPIQNYIVKKNYGRYHDEIYKKDFFSDSIVLISQNETSKVFNILNGKIFYIGMNEETKKHTIIIEHKNNLFTIFSNLNTLNRDLKIDHRIRKGKVISETNEALTFQVIQNKKYINPLNIFK